MFPCTICDVKLNSAEQKAAHCRGKNHIKRVSARDKALELGTDFDSTPDHCDVCNVPLTSKMTAIDHFKGKMHQKKVKAVEDLRQGFRNFCDVCDVRLQSLKVSEAHFNGKQHRKRERKMNSSRGKDKSSAVERKAKELRAAKLSDVPQIQASFGVVSKQPCANSSTWESLNCDNDRDSKDMFSEFRSSLSWKSNSPGTPHSTSPQDSKKTYFSFDSTVIPTTSSFSTNQPTYDGRREYFNNNGGDTAMAASSHVFVDNPPVSRHNVVFKNPIQQNHLPSKPTEDVLDTKAGLWESKAKGNSPNYLNETCGIDASRELEFGQEYSVNGLQNGVAGRSQELKQTQAVIHVLRQTIYPISSGDIARQIGCMSPSEVNTVLADLEKHKMVTKSGYSPILWCLATSLRTQNSGGKQLRKTYPINGTCPPEKYPNGLAREPHFFPKTNDPYLVKNADVTSALPTNQVFPTAIFSSPPTFTTTTPSKPVHPIDIPQVFESNLINLFQQLHSPITTNEILKKLGFPDESKLSFALHKLLERRVILKEGEAPQRWRLASGNRFNGVGVIGEERKRKSPVQNGLVSSETQREKTPSPPQQNGFPQQIPNGFRSLTESEVRVSLRKDFSYEIKGKPNDGWQHLNHFNGQAIVPNGNGIHDVAMSEETCMPYFHESQIPRQGNRSDFGKPMQRTSPAPPSTSLQTETNEFLDDLTETTPSSYQKELYQQAMQEDVVCYLPTGTGQGVVMAQVVHHMLILNPNKQALVVVEDTVSALDRAQSLRKELSGKSKRKKINVAMLSGQLKQSNGKGQVVVVSSSSCLCLLNCGALSWRDVCLLVFDQAALCWKDDPAHQILRDYYIKAKADVRDTHVPKLLSFLDSSAGEDNLPKTVAKFNGVLGNMGDVFLSCVTEFKEELAENKCEAMFVSVGANLTKEEERMFAALHSYLNLVFENLAAQWQSLNSYRELFKLCFQRHPINGEAFAKLVRLTGQPLEKRLPSSCLKTWRHYLAICEVIFALIECGEEFAKDLLGNLKREAFGLSWANDAGLPANELALHLLPASLPKKIPSGSGGSNVLGSGIRELLEQLMIIQWENARVSSERPLALVIVKLSKTAKALANYLARCPELVKRNVKTTFIDGTRSCQQKALISAIKRRQYQVIVSTDDVQDSLELPHCELVILLDQPTSLSALVQLRKRQGRNVVAICRDHDGEKQLKELLKREEFVEQAIAVIRGVESVQ